MQKYEDNLAAPINGNGLQALSGARITVTSKATGLPAALFSDNGVTPLTQPLTTDDTGYFTFHAADGTYVLTFSGVRFATFTREVILEDPQEDPYATLAQLSAGSGSALVMFTQAGAGAVPVSLQALLREQISVTQFGARCDGVNDDADALEATMRAVCPYATSYPSSDALLAAFAHVEPRVVRIPGQCRMTRPLLVPAGVILQTGPAYFTREMVHGLYYDAADLSTAAVYALVYKRQGDGSYAIYTDTAYIPTGDDFDSGAYMSASKNASISCSVLTKPGVKIGVSLIGAQGMVTHGLSIGENTSPFDTARIPKVGLVQSAGWGTVHNALRIIARVQPLVVMHANGGAVFNQPYLARNGADNNDLDVPVYVSGYTKGGSIGVMLDDCNDVKFYGPIVEHCCTAFVANQSIGVVIDSPHIEAYGGRVRHCFAAVASSLTVSDPSSVTALLDANSSMVWQQDCTASHSIIVRGQLPSTGLKMVTGATSAAILEIERLNHAQAQYGSVGDPTLIGRVNYDNPANGLPFVQVAATGSNQNWGLHGAAPVATLDEAAKRLRVLGGRGFLQMGSDLTAAANIDLSRIHDVTLLTGSHTLTLASGISFQVGAGQTQFTMGGGTLNAPATPSPWQFVGDGMLRLFLTGGAAVTSSFALVLFTAGATGRAEIFASGASIAGLSKYAHAAAGGYGVVTLGICTPTRNTAIDAAPVVNSVAVASSDFRNT